MGYTELSATYFAQARGIADSSNMLPYFAGTGPTVARCYPDKVLASAYIRNVEMIASLIGILVIGFVAGLCVPRLPLEVPRRDFELYSWIAAFQAGELVGGKQTNEISKNMELQAIQDQVGELRFRFAH